MKIRVENLGVLKEAEFSLGDLTIICGNNNTGKTYASYALFGFLYGWRDILSIDITDEEINQLWVDGVMLIELTKYVKLAEIILGQASELYTKQLPTVLAAKAVRFKDTKFLISVESNSISLLEEVNQSFRWGEGLLSMTKELESSQLMISWLFKTDMVDFPKEVFKRFIANNIKELIFAKVFPRPFIASAERTGVNIFRKELNFARSQHYEDYALPIKTNVDLAEKLETIVKKNSFIAENYSEVLDGFSELIGGDYTVTSNDELYYKPKGKRIKLSMDECSSGVRSLLNLGFYLRHEAQFGDLLMVDEPELNLHPENQRKIARLFARLINLGIKIFITTHSDYIVKEFNTLIMLNDDQPYLKRIAKAEGYITDELLFYDRIKVYMAEEVDGMRSVPSKKIKYGTLTPVNIDPRLGINGRNFDPTIETMNRIQEAIAWGG